MPNKTTSSRFAEIYDTLPPETRRVLVEKQLIVLLDSIPQDKSNDVILAVRKQQESLRSMPTLDVKEKRKEIKTLLDALDQDAKISILKERSNREELLAELADSLTSWLPDIWSVVYEYNVNYLEAHMCLLFVSEVVSQLARERPGGCRCAVMNMPIDVIIRSRHGKVIKTFDLRGIPSIDQITLWIWRDLFVSLSATGSRFLINAIPDMLEEIESVMGWSGLDLLLYGGKKDGVDDDDDENDDSPDGSNHDGIQCSCPFHARHWSGDINKQRLHLQDPIQKRLHTIFQTRPSLQLFNALQFITLNDNEDETWLFSTLSAIAPTTPETLAAALDIYSEEQMPAEISSLLDSHSYLLRPRDAPVLQSAVIVLAHSGSVFWHARSIQIIEKELYDCISAVHAAVRSAFSRIDGVDEKRTFSEIMNLPPGAQRQDRIQQWADAITTTSISIHPAAFAAMMMGFPMAPNVEEGDNPELNAYLDLSQADPDSDDLREEFQPNIEDRFEGWYKLSNTIKGGPGVLARAYQRAVEVLPFLRATDAITEITNRLGERPSKSYVIGALQALASFCQAQRRKIGTRRTKARTHRQPSPPPLFGAGATGFPFTFNGGPTAGPSSHIPNGPSAPLWKDMEDVD